MKTITKNDLVNLMLSQIGQRAKMINIVTRTEQKTNKFTRSEPKLSLEEVFKTNKIFKRSKLNVQINADYENAVNARLEKAGEEANFTAQKLSYGSYVGDSKIVIQHKDEHYLRVYQINSVLGKTVVYEKANGQHLSEDEVSKLKKEFLSEKPEEVKSQGLSYEQAAKPNNYKVSSIIEVTIDGELYFIS
jgi:hypothetical protein